MGLRQKLFGLDNQTTQSSKSFEVWQEADGSIQAYQNGNALVAGEVNSTGGIEILVGGQSAKIEAPGEWGVAAATIVPYRVFCQMSDDKYLCTDLNGSYGNYGVRLWTYEGDIATGSGTKTNLIYANVSLGDVYDASGTVIVGGGGAGIQQAWELSSGDILFSGVGKSSGGYDTKHYLWRAKSGTYTIGSGAAATDKRAVLNLGTATGLDAPGSQVVNIRMLHSRSLCEVVTSVNGALTKTIILAEYNVASGRVSGGTNDQVIAWKSTDYGVTWSKLLEFNTDGSHRFDHFHAVVQDPYTRNVYFLTGDNGDECAIIVWDGKAAAPAANATLATIASTPGWGVIYGDELKRYGDLVFTPDGIVALTDCDTEGAEAGTTGFVVTHVDRKLGYIATVNTLDRAADVPPLIGLRTSNGALIYGCLRTQGANTASNPYMDFWTSGDGKNWIRSARIRNYLASTGNIKELFEDAEGNVIATGSYGSGVQFTPDTQTGTSVIMQLTRAAAGTQLVVG